MSNNSTHTLWQLLSQQKVEIPIIQRDYAQGRKGNEYLRERFISGIYESVHHKKPLNLDFVYGTVEDDALWPLDGQQRLTTLWLFHWYIALRAGKLSEAECLKNFTYETRISSREFCEKLCEVDYDDFEKYVKEKNIRSYIEDQTWYYNRFSQDPTIQGMLTTLNGNNITRGDRCEDIVDGIEEYFVKNSLSKTDAQGYWETLTGEDCPIRFYYRDMKDEDMPLSDDLYIKMNARGRQLTDFENFKADLIGYTLEETDTRLLTVEDTALIDNQWTDVFWNEAKSAKRYIVDDLFFAFLRRFLLNQFIATSTLSVAHTKEDGFYRHIYKSGEYKYQSIKPYSCVLNRKTIDNLKSFFECWEKNSSILASIKPAWSDGGKNNVIPYYDKDNVASITLQERAALYAVCRYVEVNEVFDEASFKEWMRVVYNILEGHYYDEDTMISAIRFVYEFGKHSGDILHFLSSEESVKSQFAAEQVMEERFKAKLLLGENSGEWREVISQAESNAFLKGNIGCILRGDTKDFIDDIELAKKKLSKIEKYFDAEGVKEEYSVSLTKALLRCCRTWNHLCDRYLFDTSAQNWKTAILGVLKTYDYCHEVHTVLNASELADIECVEIQYGGPIKNNSANELKRLLALDDSTLVDESNVYNGSMWRLKWSYETYNFYPKFARYAYRVDWVEDKDINGYAYSFRRNELLLNTPEISIDPGHTTGFDSGKDNPHCDKVLRGWEVFFTYNNRIYSWDGKDRIYVYHDADRENRINFPDGRDYCELGDYGDMTPEQFLQRLDEIAENANAVGQ